MRVCVCVRERESARERGREKERKKERGLKKSFGIDQSHSFVTFLVVLRVNGEFSWFRPGHSMNAGIGFSLRSLLQTYIPSNQNAVIGSSAKVMISNVQTQNQT